MQKLRSLHHHGGQTVIDQLDVEGMEGVERRAHAGQDNRLELAFLETDGEAMQSLRDLECWLAFRRALGVDREYREDMPLRSRRNQIAPFPTSEPKR